jgi:hypothetical protein
MDEVAGGGAAGAGATVVGGGEADVDAGDGEEDSVRMEAEGEDCEVGVPRPGEVGRKVCSPGPGMGRGVAKPWGEAEECGPAAP